MSRGSPPEIDESVSAGADDGDRKVSSSQGGGLRSIRDRFSFKRKPRLVLPTAVNYGDAASQKSPTRDRPRLRYRWHPPAAPTFSSKVGAAFGGQHSGLNRKGLVLLPPFRGSRLLYLLIICAVFAFAVATVILQSSIAGGLFSGGGWDNPIRQRWVFRPWPKPGISLRFVSLWRSRHVAKLSEIDELRRSESAGRVGLRPPKLALILAYTNRDPRSLMLLVITKGLQKLGYVIKIFALGSGNAESLWEELGDHISFIRPELQSHVDWTSFEGIISYSLDSMTAILGLMQEPFRSVPLVWIIDEDILAHHLSLYEQSGQTTLVSHWRSMFERANVVVFPDFTLPMLYSALDTGNFFVIPATPTEMWAARSYSITHSKGELRLKEGFQENDILVLVIGSSFYYDELPWDYAVIMPALRPLLLRYATQRSFKFIIFCGNSSNGDTVQELSSHLGLLPGSLLHRGINDELNCLMLMSDIVVYGSSQEEQDFPLLVVRAMSFGLPILAPNSPIFTKHIVDGIHGLLFARNETNALLRCFSLLITDGKVSQLAKNVASSGRLLVENVLTMEHVVSYARLLENVFNFPSYSFLPSPAIKLQDAESWNLMWKEIDFESNGLLDRRSSLMRGSIVDKMEKQLTVEHSTKSMMTESEISAQELPSETEWNVLQEIENIEEVHQLELEEYAQRMDKDPGIWDDLYRNARKADKLNFEAHERDEGELERTGQPVCIFEIYDGPGAWPFLHHGSIYRGLSLSAEARRLRSDDVNAVSRLPILNMTDYQNNLCEIGGMFSIANKVDNIHSRPWIGFQSWRASSRKVSLSSKAETVLDEKLQKETSGDVMYFWADVDEVTESTSDLTFWSMCDLLNGRKCRTSFEDAFRHMYSLPSHIVALPPMPEDAGRWSALHSWVMPTPSFLEFIMFARMFVDSLDELQTNSSDSNKCLLGSSELEETHCYCRIMELLVNVWAYHSGRRMIYVHPHTGDLEEQHPLEQRKGTLWSKYFNATLLKSMDEDLAEAADDGDHPREKWLWPLTGEVHWQGVYEREREERYRFKMDKKRKMKGKLNERMKSGYKQKPLS